MRAHLAVKQAFDLCDPVLSRAAPAEITTATVSEFRDRETYYAWSSHKASRFFFFCIAFFIIPILSNIVGVFVQERSRDTLKKAENAIVGVAKLLIFHDLKSAARNYSVFPWGNTE